MERSFFVWKNVGEGLDLPELRAKSEELWAGSARHPIIFFIQRSSPTVINH